MLFLNSSFTVHPRRFGFRRLSRQPKPHPLDPWNSLVLFLSYLLSLFRFRFFPCKRQKSPKILDATSRQAMSHPRKSLSTPGLGLNLHPRHEPLFRLFPGAIVQAIPNPVEPSGPVPYPQISARETHRLPPQTNAPN